MRGGEPRRSAVDQVRAECEATGFLALTGHGIAEPQLSALFESARTLFDLPLADKEALVVGGMLAGRGYEVSPEHKEYMAAFHRSGDARAAAARAAAAAAAGSLGAEPSALEGILSERFLCGPPLSEAQLADPYYSSGLGPVFFAPDRWPADGAAPGLRAWMRAAHRDMTRVAEAAVRLMGAALGLEAGHFEGMTRRHCSNLQVANYPSQLLDPSALGPGHMRKKAHTDSGLLTLLASEDWLPASGWAAGDGGLQLLSPGGEWLEVAVPEGALLLNLGSLLTRLTNGAWKSTLHRVTNPARCWDAHGQQQRQQQQQQQQQKSTRRLSVAYFYKPDYDAIIDVLPPCLDDALPNGGRRFEAMRAADLTRAGVLHKFAHLPPEEASRRYHEHMAATRTA